MDTMGDDRIVKILRDLSDEHQWKDRELVGKVVCKKLSLI